MRPQRLESTMMPNIRAIRRRTAACLLPVLLLSTVATAQTAQSVWLDEGAVPAPGEPRFPDLPAGAEVLRLENGLRVLLLPNPAQPMVSVTTQVLVGSAYEDFRTSGMSHMLEHLLFNGSMGYTQEELYAAADRLGAWNNAHTDRFFTNYIMLVPAESLRAGAELQSQMLFHSLIPADKFEKERGIVVGEIVQSRDRGDGAAAEALGDALYAGSSQAMPVLGTLSTIRNMSRDDVAAFYRNHYVPNNMITTIAGRFDRAEALAVLEELYGEAAPGTVVRPELRPAPYIAHTEALSRRAGAEHVLSLAWEAPAYGSSDYFPFRVLTALLTTPGDGILTAAFGDLAAERQPEPSSWWEQAPGFGRLVVELVLPAGADPLPYHRLVERALRAAAESGVRQESVDEVVRAVETETLIEREQLRQLSIASAEPLAEAGIDFFLGTLSALRAVDAEEVTRVLGAYLADGPHLALHVEPAADAAAAGGDDVVLERSVLKNGAVLVSLQNPGSPLFAAHVIARDRAAIDGDRPGALNLVHRLLTRGVGGCDENCLSGRLRRLGVQLKTVDDPRFPMDDYYTNGRFSWLRAECAAENGLETLLLLTDMLQYAGFTAADMAEEIAAEQALLGRAGASASRRADQLLAETLYGDHPLSHAPEGDPRSVGGLDYDTLRRVYRKAYAPANLIITVASPLPHAQLAALLEENLAGRGSAEGGMPTPPRTERETRETVSLDGPMGSVRLGSLFPVETDDADALELLVGVLSDRIQMDLRETRGLSYSVGATVDVHRGAGEFRAWVNPPRERLTEGENALAEAVRTFDPATVAAEELDRVRSALKGRLMMRRLASISQAYYLGVFELDDDLDGYTETFARLDAVTPADLLRVGRKYLAGRALATVVVD
jgi:zinc protease